MTASLGLGLTVGRLRSRAVYCCLPGSCRGWYHTDRHPGAWHVTVRCPRAARSRCAARAWVSGTAPQIPGSSPGRPEGFFGKIMARISWYNCLA
jgi:hypothetical protein